MCIYVRGLWGWGDWKLWGYAFGQKLLYTTMHLSRLCGHGNGPREYYDYGPIKNYDAVEIDWTAPKLYYWSVQYEFWQAERKLPVSLQTYEDGEIKDHMAQWRL
jgi:hypothetical protein